MAFEDNSQNYQEVGHQTTTMQQRPESRTVEMRLDNASFLDEIQNTLEGKFYDVDKDEWVTPEGSKPLINTKQGILNTVRNIKIFLNNNMILSDFTDEEIYKIMNNFSEFVINHLAANAESYCNSDIDSLRNIEALIINTVYAAVKRARMRGESKAISETSTLIERAETNKSGGIIPHFGG